MTQQEHLTTEQLSAFLDKQLTPQEQAFFDAHLQSCQRCQAELGELRRTVALLHAMPQPQLPRSFTLPAGIQQLHAARRQPQPIQQRRVLRSTLQRSVRVVSALAAAAAIIFILSGLLTAFQLHGGGVASTGSAPGYGNTNESVHAAATRPNLTQAPQAQGSTPRAAGTPVIKGHQTGTPTASPVVPTPTPTATSTTDGTVNSGPPNPPTLPSFLDFSQPVGRLTLGTLLLILSIVGLIATGRRRSTVS